MRYLKKANERSIATTQTLRKDVAAIIDKVRAEGDAALIELNTRFDGNDRPALRITREEIDHAHTLVDDQALADIRQAANNIRDFAQAQRATIGDLSISPGEGITLGHRVLPVQSCLCYVPGGGYPLYSSALMLAIPAKVAGVARVVACSPAVRGTQAIHPKTLVAMDIAGVDEIYAVGGAHAVAAFSYGTEQIAPVDLIVGPGNSFVTEAKRQCYGQVGIDFVAGPSEVLILADDTADPALIAADLLGQCEHDRVAQGILIATDGTLASHVKDEVEKQLERLETAQLARESWERYGEIAVADSMDEALSYTNERAPEHLELQTRDPQGLMESLYNYGSLFMGEYTAEVFGDYASGTNHTLPTLRAARYTGGVFVGTFLKTVTHQSYTKEAMQRIAPLVSRMARGEGLIAHAKAAEMRLER